MSERLVCEYWRRLWSDGDVEFAHEFYAPTFLLNGVERTPETFATSAVGFRSHFDGFTAAVDRIFACEDTVVTRVVYTATHAQDFPGVSARGARVEVTGLDVFRFVDGRVVEHLHEADHEAMWEQLGVRLPPGSPSEEPPPGGSTSA